MGDNELYICICCDDISSLEPYEALQWMEKHWGHTVIRGNYDSVGRRQVRVLYALEKG